MKYSIMIELAGMQQLRGKMFKRLFCNSLPARSIQEEAEEEAAGHVGL